MPNIYKLSLKALRRVADKGWPLADALQRDERIAALDDADKKLVRKLLTETFRHFGEINNFIKEPDYILALGVAAIKILELPVQPVIGQLVELDENPKYRTILNRLSQKEFISNIKSNFPNWMIGSWRKAYGEAKTQEIMEVMMQPPSESAQYDFLPSSETGNIAAKPEILVQRRITDVKKMVEIQKKLFDEAFETLKNGAAFDYSVCSLQYEEGEGLIKKLAPEKWQVIEQTRVFPCLDKNGNATVGAYNAKLKKLA